MASLDEINVEMDIDGESDNCKSNKKGRLKDVVLIAWLPIWGLS